MTLRERLDKLEPRERRLLTILVGFLAVCLLLLVPIGLASVAASKRTENQEMRDLLQSIYEAAGKVNERKAQRDALLARYARPAPPLAGFIEDAAKQQGLTAAESQDRPDVPHGKKYTERVTVVKMHKIGMLGLAKMLERIESSGHPVAVTRLNIKPRAGEPDSYEVELGVSAFDRKGDPPPASAAPTAAPAGDDEEEEL
ncbi:type II secretion system protein GspM [Sorangium sp. So ce1335]|uniref:type II secretion system protein GspM n=1 Tax=Sorangium sp. So ce1335 TaxID=3133335 RepID=UPI003F5E4072